MAALRGDMSFRDGQVAWKGGGDARTLAMTPIRMELRVGDGEVYPFGFAP